MKALRTKEYGFLLIIFRQDQTPNNHIFLLDLWKIGIRDYLANDLTLDQIKIEIGAPDIELFPLSVSSAKLFVQRGLAITKRLGINLSNDLNEFCRVNEINENHLEGSLYRCFNCEKTDLKGSEINEILTTAKLELKSNVVGTSNEKQYFIVCDKCKNSKI